MTKVQERARVFIAVTDHNQEKAWNNLIYDIEDFACKIGEDSVRVAEAMSWTIRMRRNVDDR